MNSTNAHQVNHPLNPKDDGIITALRAQVAPVKGKLDGPQARPVFDEVMEHTPEAPAVAYEAGVVGGVRGWTDLALTGQSLRARAEDDPLITKGMLAATAAAYLGTHDPRDPLASPLYGPLKGLPPIQLHVGTREALLDDTLRYAARARAEGVDATAHVWEGMTHVFPASVGSLDAADKALNIVAAFIADRLGARR